MSRFDNRPGHNIYLTPLSIINALGGWEANDLDPAYLPVFMQPWKTAKHSFYEENNGLKQDWQKYGSVWLNPPYLREKGTRVFDWCKKMADHNNGLLLINSDTETAHYQDLVLKYAQEVLLIRRRIQFMDINGNPIRDKNGKITGNQKGNTLAAFGDHSSIRLIKAVKSGKIEGQFIKRHVY